jgi:mannose-6-phosphate isomerase
MYSLYPLKFKTIFKDKIWGGNRINTVLGRDYSPLENCGEAWLISGFEDEASEVENGFLEGNQLDELIEVYMGDLVGEKVYDKFGLIFPLLIKFIDSNDYLSIQVHPNDELAAKRHNSFGKDEMWYILHAEKDAEIIAGFNKDISKDKYLEHFNNKTLTEILNFEKVNTGDVINIPSGLVHALGPGILLAEIQQTSDITYRIYDWDRVDDEGNPRELHTEEAVDAIDYSFKNDHRKEYPKLKNFPNELVKCDKFTTNMLDITTAYECDFIHIDSFVVYICTEGSFEIDYIDGKVQVNKGEVVLVPAEIKNFHLIPSPAAKTLEVYLEM